MSSSISSHEAVSLDQVLTEVASIAIWNRKKLAVVTSLAVWGANLGFLIQGKSLFLRPVIDLNLYTDMV
jgi:hypothetical protein